MANAPPEWAKREGWLAGLTEFEVYQAWDYAIRTSGFLDCTGSSPGTDEIFSQVVAATARFRSQGLTALSGVGDAADTGDGEGT
jgi:hypothetical protein